MARVKRLVDSIKYSGPVAVAGDCTKVRKRLTFSNDFGGHILGSVWALENCIAEDPDDIERVINEITKAKAEATQVRAILIKVSYAILLCILVFKLRTGSPSAYTPASRCSAPNEWNRRCEQNLRATSETPSHGCRTLPTGCLIFCRWRGIGALRSTAHGRSRNLFPANHL